MSNAGKVAKDKICQTCLGTGRMIDHVLVGSDAAVLRRQASIDQITAAKRMGVSSAYLSNLEQGKRKWNLDLWNRLRAACDKK